MRLSEAIRLGAMLRPQGVRLYFDEGGSCAIGAAMEATGQAYDKGGGNFEDLVEIFPELHLNQMSVYHCPRCDESEQPLFNVVTHLNDGHRWTREQIADWVESVEISTTPFTAHTDSEVESTLVAALV